MGDAVRAIDPGRDPLGGVRSHRYRTGDETVSLLADGIDELMGHTTLVGRVTEIERFGTKMLGIEVLFSGQLLTPILQGGAAIYRFTPCSPETAWKAQRRDAWALPDPIRAIAPAALLPAPAPASSRSYDYEDDDQGGDDDDSRSF